MPCWTPSGKSYHSPGTCTFYGTANSNQLLLEAMGLHVPGTAFVNPGNALRETLTREAARTVLGIGRRRRVQLPADRRDGRRALHRQRDGRAAGHGRLHQPPDPLGGRGAFGRHRDRLGRLLRTSPTWCPLLARVYPNGSADVNQFQAAGGPGLVIGELLDAGLMHEDVLTVREGGIREYTQRARAGGRRERAGLAVDPGRAV
jgi:phosphogluconate dehydratase